MGDGEGAQSIALLDKPKLDRRKLVENLPKFSKENQPISLTSANRSRIAKFAWDRSRQRQELMNKLVYFMGMSKAKFDRMLADMDNNPGKYSVQEFVLAKYAIKALEGDKFLLDWIDRNVSKAPIEIDNKAEISFKIKDYKGDGDDQTAGGVTLDV